MGHGLLVEINLSIIFLSSSHRSNLTNPLTLHDSFTIQYTAAKQSGPGTSNRIVSIVDDDDNFLSLLFNFCCWCSSCLGEEAFKLRNFDSCRKYYRYWTGYYGLPVAGWNAGNDGKDYYNHETWETNSTLIINVVNTSRVREGFDEGTMSYWFCPLQ